MNEVSPNTKTQSYTKSGLSVRQIAVIGVMTAVTCILAPFSVPIGPVPVSLTNLAIYFSIYILGTKAGTISYLVYLLIGFIGLPVFSGFTSGPEKLLGPTGGYLIGFILMAIIAGIFIDKFIFSSNPALGRLLCLLGMILGTAVCYVLEAAWLAYQSNMDFEAALFVGVIPFIPGDFIKMIFAMLAGPQIRKQLIRAGVQA